MKKILTFAACCLLMLACNNEKTSDTTRENKSSDSTDNKTPQAEFADAKYTELGKRMNAQFLSGNIDSMLNMYADSAVYQWSAGDSLKGKEAISAYWKNRRLNVMDSIEFSNDIWLPIKVNFPQKGPDFPGVWLLNWYQVNVKFKNGQRLRFWTHVDHHFNANDKIDRTIQYIDRAPIKASGN